MPQPQEIPLVAAITKARKKAGHRGLIVENDTGRPVPAKQNGPDSKQLMLWPDRMRGLPNPVARSSLFTTSNKPRKSFKNHPIATVSGIDIFYTGEELRQQDEDVFLQIVHLARTRPLGDVIEVTGYQLLKSLGWLFNSRSYTRLRDSIERLTSGSVKIHFESGKAGYMGTMIQKVLWNGEGSSAGRTKWWIYLDSDIINLFGSDDYSLVDWEQRLRLRDLSKWLHSFYLTHAEPFPYKVSTIYTMCGSQAKSLAHFRSELKGALEDLKECGFLIVGEITGEDLVEVKRARPGAAHALPMYPSANA